jgi:formamidopyrimidine-DNA glycosylase
MPELPEVETTRRGIAPLLEGHRIIRAVVREPRLRWLVMPDLDRLVADQLVGQVSRRGKYLLLRLDSGNLIVHLGMSGSLRVISADTPAGRHDHVDLILDDGHCLRLRDPRRFGTLLWTAENPLEHPLLVGLGPEPLGAAFNGDWLFQHARGRRAPVKGYLMDSRVVAGVGNIYANEALFLAGIHPARPAGRISPARYQRLADAVQEVLTQAITAGGTTLRDFVGSDGNPGYFSQRLQVYGREGLPCEVCGCSLRRCVVGQRSSYFCPHCQT